jgi:hypothetical protein
VKVISDEFLRKPGELQMIQEMSLDLFGERFAVFTPPAGAEEDLKLAEALRQRL